MNNPQSAIRNPQSGRFRREIHPIAKTLDAQKGIVEYVASDESLDRDREILCASGWRFTNFAKNSPFLDNHNYDSIESLLGKVLDARVENKQLVETVQWAIDVPDNTLAQLGFKMTDAGYLKAVSIGGFPIKIAVNDGSKQFKELVKSFGQPENAPVKRIFLEQEQVELSACSLAANTNALAKSYKAGLLSDADLESLSRIYDAPIRKSQNPDPDSETAPSAASSALADWASGQTHARLFERIQKLSAKL